MVWAIQSEVSFSASEGGVYKFLVLESTAPVIGWAVSVNEAVSEPMPRLRVGFLVPFVAVSGRQLFGPDQEVFRGLAGQPAGLHQVNLDWLQFYPQVASRVDAFGVAVAADRGVPPCTFTLWRLT